MNGMNTPVLLTENAAQSGNVGVWPYLAIVGLIILSAFFSGSEISYASANQLRLKHNIEDKPTLSAKWALYIYEAYDKALTTILIGNNLVNIAASSVATLIVIELLGEDSAWIATLAMTLLILTFGEIIPKIIAKETADGFATIVSVPLRVFMVITWPAVWIVTGLVKLISRLWEKTLPEGPSVTEDDLENIIETVGDEGVIDEDRADLLHSALDFDEVLAYEIITPRVDMLAVDIEDDIDDIKAELMESRYSRIPVYEDSIDNIVGILHLNHLFKALTVDPRPDIAPLLMPVHFVHKTMALPDVLAFMKRRQCHMVIVTDEYGGTMGCLTMEDVLEQLVGDIWDESDVIVDELKQLDETHYEVDGDMRIYDFLEEFDIDDDDFDDDNSTVGGWAIEMLGGYPHPGDSFDYKNLTVTVNKLRNLRVVRVGVRVNTPPVEEDYSTLDDD